MVDAAQSIYSIIPAQLSYLTIYNPTLGPTDETFQQQLVFYYSRTEAESKLAARRGVAQHSKEDTDERLRRIGIAQGLVEFARYGTKSHKDAVLRLTCLAKDFF